MKMQIKSYSRAGERRCIRRGRGGGNSVVPLLVISVGAALLLGCTSPIVSASPANSISTRDLNYKTNASISINKTVSTRKISDDSAGTATLSRDGKVLRQSEYDKSSLMVTTISNDDSSVYISYFITTVLAT